MEDWNIGRLGGWRNGVMGKWNKKWMRELRKRMK
jgi:hypothetical protein